MKAPATKARRAGMVATGLTLAAFLSLAPAVASSAASPGFHVKDGSQWTVVVQSATCEVVTFQSNGTFTADRYGDSGTWKGGGATLTMKWKAGALDRVRFSGTALDSGKVYEGSFSWSGNVDPGQVGKGGATGC